MMRDARLSAHARSAMARRQVSEAAVRSVLAAPQAVMPDERAGRLVYQGFALVGAPSFTALLRVVVDEGPPPEVVTVYPTTQFRRYGATR